MFNMHIRQNIAQLTDRQAKGSVNISQFGHSMKKIGTRTKLYFQSLKTFD